MNNLFFELIHVSLGTQICLSWIPRTDEWKALYDMAKKQSLVGICFAGVQKLCNSETEDYCGMNELQYLTWMGMAAKIQQRNQQMDEYTQKTLECFRKEGLPWQVLKGKGIAKLYGSLQSFRQSGDVDVWVSGGRKKLYELSKKCLVSWKELPTTIFFKVVKRKHIFSLHVLPALFAIGN